MSSVQRKIFEYRITVTDAHLDELRHVNNVVYVQWMQEAAASHWNSVAPPEIAAAVAWMVRRHEVEYLAQAFSGDVLVVRTWTGDHSAATWDRHYEILRESDGKKIVEARSVWVLLDKPTGRPRRIDGNVLACFDKG